MKRYITIILFIFCLFILQTTIFNEIKIVGNKPNLVLVIVSIAGFMYGREYGMFAGVFGGLLTDLIYRDVVGVTVMILAVIGYLNGLVGRFYEKDDNILPVICISSSSFLCNIMFYITNFMLRGRLHVGRYLYNIIIPEMFYTLILGIVIYYIFLKIDIKLNPVIEERLDKGNDKV